MPNSIFDCTIADMTHPELEAAARRGVPILLPVGVIEQHGPHLPLGTDAYGAVTLARLVRERLAGLGIEVLIAPPFYWGVNAVTAAFAGSIRIRPETARALLVDLCASLAEDGLRRQYVLNHHGDQAHLEMVHGALGQRHADGHTEVHWADVAITAQRLGTDTSDPRWVQAQTPDDGPAADPAMLDIHATGPETALVARYWPELVRFDALEHLEPVAGTPADLSEWRRGGEHARRVTPDGYFGAPWPARIGTWQFYERSATALAAAIAAHLASVSDAPAATVDRSTRR